MEVETPTHPSWLHHCQRFCAFYKNCKLTTENSYSLSVFFRKIPNLERCIWNYVKVFEKNCCGFCLQFAVSLPAVCSKCTAGLLHQFYGCHYRIEIDVQGASTCPVYFYSSTFCYATLLVAYCVYHLTGSAPKA